MMVPPSGVWKLLLAVTLAAAIFVSAYARAPRRAIPGADLRRLVLCALGLYAVGALASLTHHVVLAGLVYAAGIVTCTIAAWLSRGTDSEDPPYGVEPAAERPPPEPDDLPELDWEELERAFHGYPERESTGVA